MTRGQSQGVKGTRCQGDEVSVSRGCQGDGSLDNIRTQGDGSSVLTDQGKSQ